MNKFFIIIILIILSTKLFANPNIQARTGILIDHHSNEILYELEPDAKIYPASMTKIMTAIVAFDLLKKNKISLDDKFTISENAWRLSQAGYSSMFIMINDQVSVENLLRGIIIASGNDACVALAEGIAGSEANFADMMNEKAGEIGMTSTNFTNSSHILKFRSAFVKDLFDLKAHGLTRPHHFRLAEPSVLDRHCRRISRASRGPVREREARKSHVPR